jgi:Domain of unknown function (DUF932)
MTIIQSYTSAFESACSETSIRQDVPAAYAVTAAPTTGDKYVFIDTAQLITALQDHGFHPTQAIQLKTRKSNPVYAKHMLRFRHIRESVTLVDAVPELILINAHDGTSAYQLRSGLYRPVCTNGMMTCLGDFDFIRVPHRGNVVANVVDGAIQISRGFADVGHAVEEMARRELSRLEQLKFAEDALRVRYTEGKRPPFHADQLLQARRFVDRGNDLWRIYNVVQENVMQGGVPGTAATGRATHTRGIRAIREDVRINTTLWQLAMRMIRG